MTSTGIQQGKLTLGTKRAVIILAFFTLFASWFCSSPVRSTELNLLYIEYPPYYELNRDGNLDGILVNIANKVFDRAGVKYKYRNMPPKRIMLEMEKGTPVASLGWLKTTEREKFAKFSLPIYLNKPVGVFMLRQNMSRFAEFDSFDQLMDSRKFSIGRIEGHSEGEYLDSMLADHTDKTAWVSTDEVQLIKMLKAKRFDFILLAPEEMDALVNRANCSLDDFHLQAMRDIPNGNARHIMYAKSIDDEFVKMIDKIIVEEIGQVAPAL